MRLPGEKTHQIRCKGGYVKIPSCTQVFIAQERCEHLEHTEQMPNNCQTRTPVTVAGKMVQTEETGDTV